MMLPALSLEDINQRLESRTARIAVIGLGYVGLPVACEFARAGFEVLGVELRAERVEMINAGKSPIEGDEPGLAELLAEVIRSGRLRATTDYEDLRGCDVVLIDVETPVDKDNRPRYEALRSVLCDLGPVLQPGALVIVESTIAPGTMDGLVRPLLEEHSGLKLNEGFFLGNCPERVMPGKLLANLRGVSRVVGGMTPETAETMVNLYRTIVKADLDPADCVTAEIVKTAENAYRDVQIAFANEVALICEAVGGDVWKVRELVNKSPGRQMHLPGAGVGGHCLPKDPWLLAYGAVDSPELVRLIPAAREVNDSMPAKLLEMLEEALSREDLPLLGARILVLGYTYLENTDDTRNSPSEKFVEELVNAGAVPVIHDPYVQQYQGDVETKAQDCDAGVLMVKHEQYLSMKPDWLLEKLKRPVLLDGRGIFNHPTVKTIGRSTRRS